MRKVHLIEETDEPGGCMRFISHLPRLAEWARHTSCRSIQLRKLRDVELIAKVTLDAGPVLEYGADTVIVATGSHWVCNGLSGFTHDTIPGAGATEPHCLTPAPVFAGKATAERVVAYDTDGDFMGASMGQLLARQGKTRLLRDTVRGHRSVHPIHA